MTQVPPGHRLYDYIVHGAPRNPVRRQTRGVRLFRQACNYDQNPIKRLLYIFWQLAQAHIAPLWPAVSDTCAPTISLTTGHCGGTWRGGCPLNADRQVADSTPNKVRNSLWPPFFYCDNSRLQQLANLHHGRYSLAIFPVDSTSLPPDFN